jgi:hypothetical protein
MSKKKPAVKSYRPPGSVPFPEARGKTLADLYLTLDSEANCITLTFDDRTEMVFDIDFLPRFTVAAEYSDWKTGDQRVLRRWPARRSRSD